MDSESSNILFVFNQKRLHYSLEIHPLKIKLFLFYFMSIKLHKSLNQLHTLRYLALEYSCYFDYLIVASLKSILFWFYLGCLSLSGSLKVHLTHIFVSFANLAFLWSFWKLMLLSSRSWESLVKRRDSSVDVKLNKSKHMRKLKIHLGMLPVSMPQSLTLECNSESWEVLHCTPKRAMKWNLMNS